MITTTPTDRTMQAVLHDRYGTSGVLRLGRVAIPVVGATTCSSTSGRPGWTVAPST